MSGEPDAIVAAMQAEWRAAFDARDLDRLLGLYAPDAMFFGSAPGMCIGRDAIGRYFRSLPSGITLADFTAMSARQLDNRVVVASGMWTFLLDSERLLFRLSWTLSRTDDRWLIAQHHAGREPAAPL